jgi:hypothetical protein
MGNGPIAGFWTASQRARAVTADLALACLVSGLIAGWLLRSIFIVAELSRVQERMQRKINHWQRETARARSIAEQLACQLAALTGRMPDDQHWSQDQDDDQ